MTQHAAAFVSGSRERAQSVFAAFRVVEALDLLVMGVTSLRPSYEGRKVGP